MDAPDYSESVKEAIITRLKEVGELIAREHVEPGESAWVIQQAECVLMNVLPQPSGPMAAAVRPIKEALVTDERFKYDHREFHSAFGSAMNELARISLPDMPYEDIDIMKRIFQSFLFGLKELTSGPDTRTDKFYIRGCRILEAMRKLKTCLIVWDIECDAMVVELFQVFFDIIRLNHTSEFFDKVLTAMTMLINEGDDISLELMRTLLSSIKLDNKDVSPTCWELGKTLFEKCATKLQPDIRAAVQVLNLDTKDYAEIVSSLCQDAPDGENPVANEVVATVGPSSDEASKFDGRSNTELEDCTLEAKDSNQHVMKAEKSSEALKCPEQTVQVENDKSIFETLATDISEAAQQQKTDDKLVRRRRGRKPNSLLRPEEGYFPTWAMGRQASCKFSRDANKRMKKDLPAPSEPGKVDVVGGFSGKEPDSAAETAEASICEKGQSKGDSVLNQHGVQDTPSRHSGKKASVGVKRGGSNAPKRKRRGAMSGQSAAKLEIREIGLGSNDSEGKTEPSLEERSSKRSNRGGKASRKRKEKDASKNVGESSVSEPAEDKQPVNLAPEKGMKSRTLVDYGEEMVNARIMIWWPMDKTYYTGTVVSFDVETKQHKVIYDDDEEEILTLKDEIWEMFNEDKQRQVQLPQEKEADCPSAKQPTRVQKRGNGRRGGSLRNLSTSSSKRSKSEGCSTFKQEDPVNNESDDEASETYYANILISNPKN